VITTTDLGSAGAVRRPAKVEGVVVNSIQTSFVGKRMMELIEAPVAFDRGARAKWRGHQFIEEEATPFARS